MNWKYSSCVLCFLLLMCVACKNTGKKVELKPDEKGISSVKEPSNFNQNAPLSTPLSDILPSCAESEEYRKNEWLGKNNCSWALDKHIISQYPEYVKRDEKGISFQTDQGDWSFLAVSRMPNDLLVNAYIPDFHLFILKHHVSKDCPEYFIYDPKSDQQTTFKGSFYLSPTKQHFAVLSSANCVGSNIVGRFSKGKGIISKDFSTQKMVKGIKWAENKLAIALESGEKPRFEFMELP